MARRRWDGGSWGATITHIPASDYNGTLLSKGRGRMQCDVRAEALAVAWPMGGGGLIM